MKHFQLAVFALSTGLACIGTPTLAAGRCDNPRGTVDQHACAKAAEGGESLRRFVERTRMIYGLYYYDFAPEAVAAATAPSDRVASSATRSSAPRRESPR